MSDAPSSTDEPLIWGEAGLPRSALYGDVYFSSDDGLEETRAVFLKGCGLPQAWAGRRAFTVGELGFGTGLNIAALLDLWARERPPGARLNIFSLEAHPIDRDAAMRALSRWPQLGEAARLLLARWPGRARGFHRVELPEFSATLDLAVMDAAEALAAWQGRADAWFLDGFAPATNPAMWSEDLLSAVAARSNPGARAATFTVAGAVRRGLAAVGFAVEKAPGFGRKRERLEARLPGNAPADPPPLACAVIGAGIAGASLRRALTVLGHRVTVFDPDGPGGGASGNPAALATPRLDAGLGPPARLFAQAFAHAVRLYDRETPGAIIARGALQLQTQDRDGPRFAKIAASDLFEPDALTPLPAEATEARLGEAAAPGLAYRDGLIVEPGGILAGWLGEVRRQSVERLEPRPGGGWRLLDAAGDLLIEADTVFLTAGHASARLAEGIPLSPVRGQASWTNAETLPVGAAFGGYAIPTRSGILFGATHDRGDEARDLRPADNARNLEALAKGLPALAARLAEAPLEARASIRAATPDRMPLAGPIPGATDLFVLSGLGARGFTLAPLLAEHLAAAVSGAPSPLPAPLARLVAPSRFNRET